MRFLIILLIATVLGAWAIVTFQPSSGELRELKRMEQEKLQQLQRLEAQNEELRTELNRLKNDKFYLEKFARENFGLCGTNELIFKFE